MSSTKSLHIPPPINASDFQISMIKVHSYSLKAISEAIIRFVSQPASSQPPKQKQGLKRFRHDGSWNIGNLANFTDLCKYFEILSDVLFNGLLAAF
jgi:hypothetical protein